MKKKIAMLGVCLGLLAGFSGCTPPEMKAQTSCFFSGKDSQEDIRQLAGDISTYLSADDPSSIGYTATALENMQNDAKKFVSSTDSCISSELDLPLDLNDMKKDNRTYRQYFQDFIKQFDKLKAQQANQANANQLAAQQQQEDMQKLKDLLRADAKVAGFQHLQFESVYDFLNNLVMGSASVEQSKGHAFYIPNGGFAFKVQQVFPNFSLLMMDGDWGTLPRTTAVIMNRNPKDRTPVEGQDWSMMGQRWVVFEGVTNYTTALGTQKQAFVFEFAYFKGSNVNIPGYNY